MLSLILGEALTLGIIGGVLGVGLASMLISNLSKIPGLGAALQTFPNLGLNPRVTGMTFVASAALGLSAGLAPAVSRVPLEHYLDAEAGLMALPISYNIRNLIVRWKVTLLAIGGIALVVAVMLVLVAMSTGFRDGAPRDRVPRQRHRHPARANSELTSGFTRDNANMIMVDSRVARDDQGKPLASPKS